MNYNDVCFHLQQRLLHVSKYLSIQPTVAKRAFQTGRTQLLAWNSAQVPGLKIILNESCHGICNDPKRSRFSFYILVKR